MKSIVTGIVLLTAAPSFAATTATHVARGLEGSACMEFLIDGVDLVAKASNTVKENINSNLDGYEALANQIRMNLAAGRSNAKNYQKIKNSIQMQKTGTGLTGYVSEKIANCIEANVSFSGPVAQQDQAAQKAIAIIQQARAEIND